MSWEKLTRRERQTAILLLKGYTNKGAGQILIVSPRTVETYRSQVFAKFEVKNARQLRETVALPATSDQEIEEMSRSWNVLNDLIMRSGNAVPPADEANSRTSPIYSRPDIQNVRFLASNVLPPLVGATIQSIACITDVSGPMENASIGLVVRLASGELKIAWIDMDPEGNGPGWVKVEDPVRNEGVHS